MATISKNVSHSGYCPVDKDIAPIPIEYISFSDDGSTKRNMTFRKISNQCSYLADGRCKLGKECPIYKNAKKEIKLDISDMCY